MRVLNIPGDLARRSELMDNLVAGWIVLKWLPHLKTLVEHGHLQVTNMSM